MAYTKSEIQNFALELNSVLNGYRGKFHVMLGTTYVNLGEAELPTNKSLAMYFRFDFKMNRIMNVCTIYLDRGIDAYVMEFGKSTSRGYKRVKLFDCVYVEDVRHVFEETTGLYLTL